MTKKYIVFIILIIGSISIQAQHISGKLSKLKHSEIKLNGFKGMNNYLVASTVTDGNGNFKLAYSKENYGIAYLISTDNKPFIVVLGNQETVLSGNSLADLNSLKIEEGAENKLYDQYADENPARDQALSAWDYLDKLYSDNPLFASNNSIKNQIKNEIKRIEKEDNDFLNKLPADSFVKWYFPIRKLISSVPVVVQYTPEKIPETLENLRKIDFSDSKLYSSGLLKDAVEAQFLIIENSAESDEKAMSEMKISVDVIVNSLKKNNVILNEVTEHLFHFLEQRSYFQISEYLATKVLNDDECGCSIDPGLTKQLEQYRKMKVGNKAPDIAFTKDLITVNSKGSVSPKKLSDIQSKYKLIVFGSSWCPGCVKEIPVIAQHYSMWKNEGMEVVFISLDTDKNEFFNFTKTFPFISYCDYEKWDSLPVSDYSVFATPTMYLLDENNTILSKPESVEQVNSWLDNR